MDPLGRDIGREGKIEAEHCQIVSWHYLVSINLLQAVQDIFHPRQDSLLGLTFLLKGLLQLHVLELQSFLTLQKKRDFFRQLIKNIHTLS
jgi:hypothetical protein